MIDVQIQTRRRLKCDGCHGGCLPTMCDRLLTLVQHVTLTSVQDASGHSSVLRMTLRWPRTWGSYCPGIAHTSGITDGFLQTPSWSNEREEQYTKFNQCQTAFIHSLHNSINRPYKPPKLPSKIAPKAKVALMVCCFVHLCTLSSTQAYYIPTLKLNLKHATVFRIVHMKM